MGVVWEPSTSIFSHYETHFCMHIFPTSERLVEADALLKEASQKVHEFRNTLSPESYNMAQGLLE